MKLTLVQNEDGKPIEMRIERKQWTAKTLAKQLLVMAEEFNDPIIAGGYSDITEVEYHEPTYDEGPRIKLS